MALTTTGLLVMYSLLFAMACAVPVTSVKEKKEAWRAHFSPSGVVESVERTWLSGPAGNRTLAVVVLTSRSPLVVRGEMFSKAVVH